MTDWKPVIVKKEVNDEHFYYVNDEYYPGVTTILNETLPMPFGLRQWIGDMGNLRAEEKYNAAAERGSALHQACERLIQGEEIHLPVEFPNHRDQKALVGFMNWFHDKKPTLIGVEMVVASAKRFAGTLDIACKIDGELYIVDIKTSNSIHDSHKLQIAAYAAAWQEMNGVLPKVAILHLNPRVKAGYTFDTDCLIKKQPVTIDDFMKVYDMYVMLNRGIPEPNIEDVYPEKLSLAIEEKKHAQK